MPVGRRRAGSKITKSRRRSSIDPGGFYSCRLPAPVRFDGSAIDRRRSTGLIARPLLAVAAGCRGPIRQNRLN